MIAGRYLIIALVVFAALFGGLLWYFQTYAFYADMHAETVTIAGTEYEISNYRGIDATTSPLKLRACFTLNGDIEAPQAPNPTPLVAPDWFDCFDAKALDEALKSGEAKAWLAEKDEFDGIDRLVARYPDGRAYEWRQVDQTQN